MAHFSHVRRPGARPGVGPTAWCMGLFLTGQRNRCGKATAPGEDGGADWDLTGQRNECGNAREAGGDLGAGGEF
jgi:hypothetical protein